MAQTPPTGISARIGIADGLFGSVERWVGPIETELSQTRQAGLKPYRGTLDETSQRKWEILVTLLKSQSAMNQLRLVQSFVNSQPYRSDKKLWGKEDYWATAQEFLIHGGDCEDYALAKYRALIDAGFAEKDLRLVLVEENFTRQQHAILVVTIDGRRLVMDNRRDEIEDHNLISNYRPLYSMSQAGLWRHHDYVQPMPDIAVATPKKR